jgi:hypothetical protein
VISEIPVRRADVLEFLDGQRVPDAIRSSPSGKQPPPRYGPSDFRIGLRAAVAATLAARPVYPKKAADLAPLTRSAAMGQNQTSPSKWKSRRRWLSKPPV